MLGLTCSWVEGLVDVIRARLLASSKKNQVSIKPETGSTTILQVSPSSSNDSTFIIDKPSWKCSVSPSTTAQNISQSHTRDTIVQQRIIKNMMAKMMVENDPDIDNKSARELLKESMDGIYQYLEEIKRMNTNQFTEIRKTIEMNETRHNQTDIHISETLKRLDALEKKNN